MIREIFSKFFSKNKVNKFYSAKEIKQRALRNEKTPTYSPQKHYVGFKL